MIDSATVNRAAKKLELRDIVLHTVSLLRGESPDPSLYPSYIKQQLEVKAACYQLLFIDDNQEEIPILRAYVRLEILGFDEDGDEDDGPLFTISAEYRVDYLINKELTSKEMDAFTSYNVVHNVWPFWRQRVQQTVDEAKLPRVTVPFFTRPQDEAKPVRTARKTPKKLH